MVFLVEAQFMQATEFLLCGRDDCDLDEDENVIEDYVEKWYVKLIFHFGTDSHISYHCKHTYTEFPENIVGVFEDDCACHTLPEYLFRYEYFTMPDENTRFTAECLGDTYAEFVEDGELYNIPVLTTEFIDTISANNLAKKIANATSQNSDNLFPYINTAILELRKIVKEYEDER